MQDIRGSILNLLRERGQATAADVASATGMSPVNAHYHLSKMEREGLVVTEPLRKGVGRPKFLYSLSSAALERFPQLAQRLTGRLLDALQSQLTTEQVEAVFNRMVDGIAAEHGHQFRDRSLEEKVEALVGILGEEGFISRVHKTGEEYQLTQCGCPYHYVAERHPSICAMDLKLIHATLGAPVERGSWLLNGDSVCTFHVKATPDPGA